jgi:hypothetical protein
MSYPSSSSTGSFLLTLGVSALVGAGLGRVLRRMRAKRARQNPKIAFDLEQQIQALKDIYPRLCQEFIDDVKDKYQFPQFALDRLKRVSTTRATQEANAHRAALQAKCRSSPPVRCYSMRNRCNDFTCSHFLFSVAARC